MIFFWDVSRHYDSQIMFIFESTSLVSDRLMTSYSLRVLRYSEKSFRWWYLSKEMSKLKPKETKATKLLSQLLEEEGDDDSRWKSEGFLWCVVLLLATLTTTIVSNQVSFWSFKYLERVVTEKKATSLFIWFFVSTSRRFTKWDIRCGLHWWQRYTGDRPNELITTFYNSRPKWAD